MAIIILASTDNNGNPLIVLSNAEEMTQNKSNDLIAPKSSSLLSPTNKQVAGVKRPRKVDATKFNRSNRESKNCGTFYFKHSDTEPESGSLKNNANDWSSQGATSELCSEEEWEYSKYNDINGNASNGNEETGDNDDLADASIQVNVNESGLLDTVDSPFGFKQVSENEKFEVQMQSTPESLANKNSVECVIRSTYKDVTKVSFEN